jgi:hypothetical protein
MCTARSTWACMMAGERTQGKAIERLSPKLARLRSCKLLRLGNFHERNVACARVCYCRRRVGRWLWGAGRGVLPRHTITRFLWGRRSFGSLLRHRVCRAVRDLRCVPCHHGSPPLRSRSPGHQAHRALPATQSPCSRPSPKRAVLKIGRAAKLVQLLVPFTYKVLYTQYAAIADAGIPAQCECQL